LRTQRCVRKSRRLCSFAHRPAIHGVLNNAHIHAPFWRYPNELGLGQRFRGLLPRPGACIWGYRQIFVFHLCSESPRRQTTSLTPLIVLACRTREQEQGLRRALGQRPDSRSTHEVAAPGARLGLTPASLTWRSQFGTSEHPKPVSISFPAASCVSLPRFGNSLCAGAG